MKKIAPFVLAALALTLSSCRRDALQPGKAEAFKSLIGTVVEYDELNSSRLNPVTKPWSHGVSKVNGYINNEVFTSATLNANGTFTLDLKDVPDNLLSGEGFTDMENKPIYSTPSNPNDMKCTGKVTTSVKGARGASLMLGVEGANIPLQNSVFEGKVDEVKKTAALSTSYGMLVYTDRPFNYSGTMKCTGTQGGMSTAQTVTVDAKLLKGWNKITITQKDDYTEKSENSTVTFVSGKLPADKWIYGGGGVSPLSLQTLPFGK